MRHDFVFNAFEVLEKKRVVAGRRVFRVADSYLNMVDYRLHGLNPELPKVMIEVPILQHVPVVRPHSAERGMDHAQAVRWCRGKTLNQIYQDFPVPIPTDTRRVECSGGRLDLPFRPREPVNRKVTPDCAAKSPGRQTLQLLFA